MKRFTRSRNFLIALIVSIATIAILVSFVMTAGIEERNRRVGVIHLREIAELDYRLKYSVLRSHNFQIEDFDAMTDITRRLGRDCIEMRGLPDTLLAGYNHNLVSKIGGFCEQTKEVDETVEKFKSKTALLKNAIKGIPEIITKFDDDRERSSARQLYSDLLLYCLQPNDTLESRIKGGLEKLSNRVSRRKADTALLKVFEARATLAFTASRERSDLEKSLVSSNLKDKIDAVTDAYLLAVDKHDRTSQLLKALAVGVAGCLIIALLILLYRLQIIAKSLLELNSTLETKVARRTSELTKALSDLSVQQEMLAHSAKMSALGEMAGGIAHEINTPLAAISLKAEMLLSFESDPIVVKTLNEIVGIVERAAKVVKGLRKFSRTDVEQPFRPCTLGAIINDTLILCREKFAYAGIDVGVPEDDLEIEVKCVPEQIGQVLLNLLSNSYDAVKSLERKWVKIEIERSGEFVVLRVTDSGSGISEAIQKKLMQPFFTTKTVGQGTGIGLSISRGIAEKHGGSLEYDPASQQTSFRLKLPVSTSAAA